MEELTGRTNRVFPPKLQSDKRIESRIKRSEYASNETDVLYSKVDYLLYS